MKKQIIKKLELLSILILCGGIFSACGNKSNSAVTAPEKDKLKIVASTYPVYDWIKNIAGDRCDITLLVDSGSDLHSWNPSAKDIVTVTGKDTDLFVYIGGESDFWVEKLIPQMDRNGVEHFSVMERNVSLLEPADEHDHDEEPEHHAQKGEDAEGFDPDEYDEHIWLSLKRVPAFVESIAVKIGELDSDNREYYMQNCRFYQAEITDLYNKAFTVCKNSAEKTLVLADRHPFKYFADDLGLDVKAAFHGCSSDTEASFDVVVKLAAVMDQNNLKTIFITETGTDRLSKTVISQMKNHDVQIKILNAVQGKVGADKNYLSIMKENVEILEQLF